jgi:gamma-glutamyl-gamma-aminobutyrate hydrolase PuuD
MFHTPAHKQQVAKKKVYIVAGSAAYRALFTSLGLEVVSDFNNADMFCFTGGEDVSPDLYNETRHRHTYNNPMRDQYEMGMFVRGLKRDIPMVGICRGGQFLNVMSGGAMFQHIQNHTHSGDHRIRDDLTGQELLVSSTHHQMMKPSPKAVLVAYGVNMQASVESFPKSEVQTVVSQPYYDYEVLYYEHTKCLCFQPHPEFIGAHYEEMHEYFHSLLKRFNFV